MKRKLSLIAIFGMMFASILMVATVPSAQADPDIIIDTFDTPQVTEQSGLGTQSNTADFSAGTLLGNERDVVVNVATAGGTDGIRTNSNNSIAGVFTSSQDAGVTGTTLITYDGNDNDAATLAANGLASTNFQPDTAFIVELVSADLGSDLKVTFYSGDADNCSSLTQPLPAVPFGGASVPVVFPFSDFTQDANCTAGPGDSTNVTAVILEVQGDPAADIQFQIFKTASADYGDLPSSYGITTNADDGARHSNPGTTVYLGSAVDSDSDGQEDANAGGDDSDGTNDDDGVTRTGLWDGNGTAGLEVVASADGCLTGWIDFFDFTNFVVGTDGAFAASEKIIDNQPVTTGTNVFSDLGGADTQDLSNETLYARFRVVPRDGGNCTANTAVELTGARIDGEVEDYEFGFGPTAVTLSAPVAAGNSGGWVVPMLLVSVLGIVTAGLWQRNKRRAAPEVEDDTAAVADTAVSQYESPAIIYEDELTTRAGSPTGLDPNGINPADLFD